MAIPVVPIVVAIGLGAAVAYVLYQRNRSGPQKMLDKAQSAVEDAADAAIDATESVADKATKAAKDLKKSMS